MKTRYSLIFVLFLFAYGCNTRANKQPESRKISLSNYDEPHRLQFHFSPDSMWMNDPNGLIFYAGNYHLFYQHYPDDNVWGPMHWGHAISKDLVHWKHLPIALYPDSLGYIFSGSAVADRENTSDFGTKENPPLVSIFTYHNPKAEQAGRVDFQSQAIAYSTDSGTTWTKYKNNPVIINNSGSRDFRDPKVFWHEADAKWVMILAVRDRVHLYSSANLKSWKKESEFTAGTGDSVWECPDLFPLSENGAVKWIMLVSKSGGGPNGGTGTQYFAGHFDGNKFTCEHNDIRWIDHGPDNYAGVTWSNVKDRRLFAGWMNNGMYANKIPTLRWRGAVTAPRELGLVTIKGQSYVVSNPTEELNSIRGKTVVKKELAIDSLDFNEMGIKSPLFDLSLTTEDASFEIKLSNAKGEFLLAGYDAKNKEFYIDRRQSGIKDFSDGFARRITAKRIEIGGTVAFRLLVDVGCAEVFADKGEAVMTSLFFPSETYSAFKLISKGRRKFAEISISEMKSIW